MSVNVSPFGPKPQFLLSTGLPAVGNQLFFYVAGSVNTKQNTFTDSTGGVANTNPIILNSLGEPSTEIWFTAGLAYKVVYAPSTDTDPPTSPIWTIDNLRGINDTAVTLDQWIPSGFVPTFVSGTSFTVPGNQTSIFTVGRKTKTTNSGGLIYSTITASAFGAGVTLITLSNDAGNIDAGISSVAYGIITPSETSLPQFISNLAADSSPVLSTDYVATYDASAAVLKKVLLNNLTQKPKIGVFQRDASLANGTQAITGVGFTPKSVIFVLALTSNEVASVGFDNVTAAGCIFLTQGSSGQWSTGNNSFVYALAAGAFSVGSVTSFDADGFTVTITKTNLPTGTYSVTYMAQR